MYWKIIEVPQLYASIETKNMINFGRTNTRKLKPVSFNSWLVATGFVVKASSFNRWSVFCNSKCELPLKSPTEMIRVCISSCLSVTRPTARLESDEKFLQVEFSGFSRLVDVLSNVPLRVRLFIPTHSACSSKPTEIFT